MTSFKINIANILDVKPNPINCLSLNDELKKLALFRGGDVSAIEIWDVSHYPVLEKLIVELEKLEEKPSVESIVWVKNRLFSGGLHGFVTEHDLVTRRIKERLAATSGPVWCLGVNSSGTLLAAGTEDGFVNIFDVANDGLIYIKVLDRQDGRVLSLSWSPCGKYIATGSTDTVRLWEVEKGHALQRLITGRTKNKETIVWSVILLDNLTIISGDSRGIVSFWNGKLGVLKDKIYTHKADVLSLKLSSDQSSIYAAGVDPIVVLLQRGGKSGDKWVKSHQRNMHTNDVTCLATTKNKLFSAGIDADLIVSSFPPRIVTKYAPIHTSSNVALAKRTNLILAQNTNRMDIWQLPRGNQESTKILELDSYKNELILSSCISCNGSYFAYTTFGKVHVFNLSTSDKSTKKDESILCPKITKLKWKPSTDSELKLDFDSNPQWNMRFTVDNCLILVSCDGTRLVFVTIDEDTATLNVQNIVYIAETFGTTGVNKIEVSANGKYIAMCSDVLVVVSEIKEYKIKSQTVLPRYRFPSTTVLFHHKNLFVFVTYTDRCVKIFNLETVKIVLDAAVIKSNNLQPLLGGSWSPNGTTIVLFDIEGLYLLEISADICKARKKVRKNSGSSNDVEEYDCTVKSAGTKYKFVAFVEFLDDGEELLAVEVKPNTVLEKLPPAFTKKRFGM